MTIIKLRFSYLLLIYEYIIVISLKPQAVHDSGVKHNQQRKGESKVDTPCRGISLAHPLLRPRVHAKIVVGFLIKIYYQQHRDIENQ